MNKLSNMITTDAVNQRIIKTASTLFQMFGKTKIQTEKKVTMNIYMFMYN